MYKPVTTNHIKKKVMCIPGTRRGCQRHNNARLLFDFLTMNLKRYRSIQLVVINGVFTKGSQAQIINAKAVSGTRSLFHLGFTKANAAREFQMGLSLIAASGRVSRFSFGSEFVERKCTSMSGSLTSQDRKGS